MSALFSLGLDLGSDTLKIAYACSAYGDDHTGKIVGGNMSMTALPAVAFYNEDTRKWIYGEDVERTASDSYSTVVKIKRLLAMLSPAEETDRKNGDAEAEKKARAAAEEVARVNAEYYESHKEFPKFYFPTRRRAKNNFAEMAEKDMLFTANKTPREVCEGFFAYAAKVTAQRLKELAGAFGEKSYEIRLALIYPPHAGAKVIDEMARLVEKGFGAKPEIKLSMPKALSVFAMHSKKISEGEKLLIFNMGEQELSVVKAGLNKGKLSVDGVDGHNAPVNIGGNDIDDSVAGYLEGELTERETMGSPSYGQEGHIMEMGLNSKQYLFVKDIKMAKIFLGMNGMFKNGVPVSVARDLYIQKRITREQFKKCIGITKDTGVANDIFTYIRSEINRKINRDIKTVFLSGGLVESYGLVEYLSDKMKSLGIKVRTFENEQVDYNKVENNGFNILEHEDAVYAQALGGALALHHNYKIKTAIAMSYGMRMFDMPNRKRFFAVIVGKGRELDEDKEINEYELTAFPVATGIGSEKSAGMRIIASSLSEEDIQACKFKNEGLSYYLVDGHMRLEFKKDSRNEKADDKKYLQKLQEIADFTVVAGGEEGVPIYYYYDRTRIKTCDKVFCTVGAQIDRDGRARIIVNNDVSHNGNKKLTVEFVENSPSGRYKRGSSLEVYARDIRFKFEVDTIKVK